MGKIEQPQKKPGRKPQPLQKGVYHKMEQKAKNQRMNVENEYAPVLRVTRDYSLFHVLSGNRGISHKDKIVKSIKAVGYVPSPIIVNEKMEVIDGQGRLEACKELALPVYYIVIPGLGITHCTSMNISQSNWNIRDFISSYAKQGNYNYINLLYLISRHPSIGLKCICAAAAENGLGVDNDTIKTGKLIIHNDTVQQADDILKWIEENIIPYKNKIQGRIEYLSIAMIFAYVHSTANRDRLASIVKNYAYDFTPIATTKHALEQIERFYNRNLKQNKVYFLVEYDKFLSDSVFGYKTRWGIESTKKKNNGGMFA